MATGVMIDNSNSSSNGNTALRAHRSITFTDTKCQYASVQSLFTELKSHRHEGLEKILKQHTFVGLVDYTYCSIQFGTRLLLLDHSTLLRHLFYQLVIRRFSEMPRIILGKPLSIKDYVLAALNSPEGQWTIKNGPKEDIVDNVLTILTENSEMLEEYFKIGVNEFGMLCTLPELLAGHTPTPEGLPMFLLRLATEVNWEDEIQCFRSIATEIGFLYAALPIEYNLDVTADSSTVEATVEISMSFPGPSGNDLFASILMPAIRTYLIAPKQCAEDGNTVVQLAALEQLYKIFERC
jgi:DNA mismatch repair protein MLH1